MVGVGRAFSREEGVKGGEESREERRPVGGSEDVSVQATLKGWDIQSEICGR